MKETRTYEAISFNEEQPYLSVVLRKEAFIA
jgi:hypothetical protein